MNETPTSSSPSVQQSRWGVFATRVWPVLQLLVSIALVGSALVWLMGHEGGNAKDEAPAPKPSSASTVSPTGYLTLTVDRDSPLGKRLPLQTVEPVTVNDALLHATGVVIASRRPGTEGSNDFWQFNSGALLSSYAAWEKATADELFAKSQLEQTLKFVKTQEEALKLASETTAKLVDVGTDTKRDLVAQQAELLKTVIQDRKDVYQAEAAVKAAHRDVSTLSLQLLQSGLDPEKLRAATAEMDIVSADVPEAMLDRVALDQSCEAKFFGIPDEAFGGKVSTLSPVLSTEQRTLRVLLVLHDPADRLRPGMFATIGVGTDPRKVIRIPAASVFHIGRTDYVMVVDKPTAGDAADASPQIHLRATEVSVSELIDGQVEVRHGVEVGTQIVSDNAILLKPVVSASLRLKPPTASVETTSKDKLGMSGAQP